LSSSILSLFGSNKHLIVDFFTFIHYLLTSETTGHNEAVATQHDKAYFSLYYRTKCELLKTGRATLETHFKYKKTSKVYA